MTTAWATLDLGCLPLFVLCGFAARLVTVPAVARFSRTWCGDDAASAGGLDPTALVITDNTQMVVMITVNRRGMNRVDGGDDVPCRAGRPTTSSGILDPGEPVCARGIAVVPVGSPIVNVGPNRQI
jgi:hypothetical protein